MVIEKFREILSSVEYKDWTFFVGEDEGHRPFLQIRFFSPCSVTGGVIPQHGRKWILSPHMTRSELIQTALKAVLTAEEHEARENFLYRGRRIFGPHLDVDVLAEIASKVDVRESR